MRANRIVLFGMGLAILIGFGSVHAASTSARNAAGEQARQIHFSGKVVDAEGGPIEGARVRFYTVSSQDARLTGDTATGSNGTFFFDAPAKREGHRYGYIVAEKGELAIGLATWPMRKNEEAEIKLGPAKEFAGIVVDENDNPVSGARINISRLQIGEGEQQRRLGSEICAKLLTVSTDSEGKFGFGRIPVGVTVEFIVRKGGRPTIDTFYAGSNTGQGYKYLYLAGQRDIKLILPIEARIEGIVVEESTHRPVAGAKVRMADGQHRWLPGLESTVSTENGTFSFDALPSGDHLVKYVPPDDVPADWIAEPTDVTLEAGKTTADVKVVLRKGGILEVLVTDKESKKPIEDARVSVYDQRHRQSYGGKTGSNGIRRIRLLPGTYQQGHAYKQDYSSYSLSKPVTIEDGQTKRLKWELTAKPAITGVVRDQNGRPMQGVSMRIMPMGGRDDVNSDAEGRFKVSWDPARSTDQREAPLLVCRHVEGNFGAVTIVPEGKRTLDVELKPAVIVRGKVVDPDGRGIASAGIRVMLRHTMWSSTITTRDSVTTDTDGNFEFRAIPVEHRYRLNVNAKGYGVKRVEFHADDAVDNFLEIEPATLARANLSVSGLVVDTQGNPIANARIESYGFGEGQPDRLTTQSDSQGKFTLEGVCEGKVDLRVDVSQKGKRLSARARAYGGATGIKLVAREGRSVVQHFSIESYEQIVRDNEKAIAGVAVDESGSPVAGVPVAVRCHKKKREGDKFSWRYSSYPDLSATTDKQGRFAIATEEDGEYNLLFSPDNKAAIIAYDIPVGKKDLKVTLPVGGAVAGRLMRMDKGKKAPVPNVEVKIEQIDRASYTHLGFDRDRTTVTDSQGRFRFEHLRTKIRPGGSRSQEKWDHIARVWEISYGDTSRTIAFYDATELEDFELLVQPDLAQLLVGMPLPGFDITKIDRAVNLAKGKMVMVCFFDAEQRPSRNFLRQLTARAQELETKGVAVVALQASKIDEDSLDKWCRQFDVSFPVAMVQGNEENTRFTWGVKSLPWLILTDQEHIVRANGFSLTELTQKIGQANGG